MPIKVEMGFVVVLLGTLLLTAKPAFAEVCPDPESAPVLEANRFEKIHLAAADWAKVVEQYKAQETKGLTKRWCEKGKERHRELEAWGHDVDIGFKVDLKDPKSYRYKSAQFGDPLEASAATEAFLRCSNQGGTCVGVKHFPGIGSLRVDPHHGVEHTVFDRDKLLYREFKPFYSAVGANACTIMNTHVPVGDPRQEREPPICTFDPECVALIREGLGYDGPIITDEILVMDGARESMMDVRYGPQSLDERKKWQKLSLQEKENEVVKRLAEQRCGENCLEPDIQSIIDEVSDKDGSYRTYLSIKAGNDIILQFRPTDGKFSKNINATLTFIADRVRSGDISESQIDQSVTRILEQKIKSHPREMAAELKGRSITEYLAGMKLGEDSTKRVEAKIAQMIVTDARYGDQAQVAAKLGLGGVYSPDEKVAPLESKIPMLIFADGG